MFWEFTTWLKLLLQSCSCKSLLVSISKIIIDNVFLLGEKSGSDSIKTTEKRSKIKSCHHHLSKTNTSSSSKHQCNHNCSTSGINVLRSTSNCRDQTSARLNRSLLSKDKVSSDDTEQAAKQLFKSSFNKTVTKRRPEQEQRSTFWRGLNVKSNSGTSSTQQPLLNSLLENQGVPEPIRFFTVESKLSTMTTQNERHLATAEDLFDDCADFEQLTHGSEYLGSSQKLPINEQFCFEDQQLYTSKNYDKNFSVSLYSVNPIKGKNFRNNLQLFLVGFYFLF